MRFYRTKEGNLINLEQVAMIYKDPEDGSYRGACSNGTTYEMPELGAPDIDKIMDYNDYFI